jgi:hypothetical protein
MKYAYQIIPALPLGGRVETVWLDIRPDFERTGHDAAAEIYAANWPSAQVTLKHRAATGRETGINYYTVTRRGFEPLTFLVTVV